MEDIVFQVRDREIIGKQVRALRRQGRLPAILYGPHIEPKAISLDFREASRVLPMVSSSHLVKLVQDNGETHTALVREKQRNPLTGALIHIDFQAVSLTEKLRTKVSIDLQGEAPAVKVFDGVLVTGQEVIEVESLPGDLPERIVVDITVLKRIGDLIRVRDLQVPAGVDVLTDADEMVVLVTAPQLERVEAAVEEAAVFEPEVIEKGKKEEEET